MFQLCYKQCDILLMVSASLNKLCTIFTAEYDLQPELNACDNLQMTTT